MNLEYHSLSTWFTTMFSIPTKYIPNSNTSVAIDGNIHIHISQSVKPELRTKELLISRYTELKKPFERPEL